MSMIRCDLLPHAMNSSKERAVRSLLAAWRKAAVAVGKEQWRLFFETGRLNKQTLDKSLTGLVGAARLQMVRYQVVGALKSFIANRANDFADMVQKSGLPADTKRLLHGLNRREAWFKREAVMIDGAEVPEDIRRLARSIMRHVLAYHRKPDLSRIGMVIDQRAATLAEAKSAKEFPLWLRLSTLDKGQRIDIPLRSYPYFQARQGKRALTIQVNQDRDSGTLLVGVITDITEACATAKANYAPLRDSMSLDFGLATLLATNEGDLLGRGWLEKLRRYDSRIAKIAQHRQRSGDKPRTSARYRAAVADLRGFVKTEIGRILNRLIALKKPAHLVVERLDFRVPGLSKRLNRILQNCGRSVFRAKLRDIEERLGVTSEEVNPAYTSQTCSCCGYVDTRNRRDQKAFTCLWCGSTMHADVNAARNIGARRSRPIGSVWQAKAAILRDLVNAFTERNPALRRGTGQRGLPADPRLSNPYFRDLTDAARSSAAETPDNLPTSPALVAA